MPKTKDKRIWLRVTESQHTLISLAADTFGMPTSDFCRYILEKAARKVIFEKHTDTGNTNEDERN